MAKNKTPDYVKKAIDNYRKDKKTVSMLFTMDQWQELNKAGLFSGSDIKKYVLDNIRK